MIQIIKHKKEEIKEYCIYEIECSCGCKFKFDEAEVYEREKRLDGNWFIKCPECNEMLEFNPTEKQVYPAIKIIDKHIDKYENKWFKECVEKWNKEVSEGKTDPIIIEYSSTGNFKENPKCPCDDCAEDFKFGISCPDRQIGKCHVLNMWKQKLKENK